MIKTSDPIRITVIGDAQVGKTSLIKVYVSEEFVEEPTGLRVLNEHHLDSDGVDQHPLCLTDTSSDSKDRDDVFDKIAAAHVLLLIFDITRSPTFENLVSYWLPELEKRKVNLPIIIVGNKCDYLAELPVDSPLRKPERVFRPIAEGYKHVQACMMCSATNLRNVQKVFYTAIKARVCPVQPLYNKSQARLEPKFMRALERVFRIFDRDRDGVLSDDELNAFQETCFQKQLKPEEIQGLKKFLRKKRNQGQSDTEPDDNTHVTHGKALPEHEAKEGITLQGFFYLNKIFIIRKRSETSWLVLRKHNFDPNLNIVLPPITPARDPEAVTEFPGRCELSVGALTFLTQTFLLFSADGRCLSQHRRLSHDAPHQSDTGSGLDNGDFLYGFSPTSVAAIPASSTCSTTTVDEVARVFRVCPDGRPPWTEEDVKEWTVTSTRGELQLPGWLALWSKLALLEPEKTEQYLFYLGFTNAHDGTGRHRCFRPEISPGRSVLRCCVVGAQGVGKSAVMRSLAQKLWLPNHSSPKAPLIKHAVTTNCGHDKLASWVRAGATLKQPSTFLVLTEVPTGTEAEFFADDELVCDVVLLLFDARQADSLAHINTVVNTCVPHFIPCVCVNNKSDLLPKKGSSSKSGAIDVVLASARTFCKRNGIAGKRSTQQEFPYMNAVGSAKDARKLYKTLVLYGKNPKSLCRKPRKDSNGFAYAAKALAGIAACGIAVALISWYLWPSPKKEKKVDSVTMTEIKKKLAVNP